MARVYPHIPNDIENEVLDFTNAPFGMLVVHSDHFHQQHGTNPAAEPKLGIITKVHFYLDSRKRIVCHPDVHWEGECMSRMSHPINVRPYRDITLPKVTIDEGQWGTYGPDGPPTPTPDEAAANLVSFEFI